MTQRERGILERSVHAIAEQAANTNKVIYEATEAGLAAGHPVTVAAKQIRLELLKVKADLDGSWASSSSTAPRAVKRCTGFRASACPILGTGGHRFPAPHGEPVV